MSKKTLVFGSIMAVLSAAGSIASSFAGTLGTADSEQSRLQDEVSAARNDLDAIVLKPGVRLDDPRVKEKSQALEEKLRAFHDGFKQSMTPPPGPKTYPNQTPDSPNGERDENDPPEKGPDLSAVPAAAAVEIPRAPDVVLSGDGIQKEIQYSKKAKLGKREKPVPRLTPRLEHVEEPVPAETVVPNAAGLSEIEYSKKKPPPK